MGAAVGVEAGSHVPADLLELFKGVETEQHTVSQRDLSFLQSQFKQMWKNHKKIISVVTRKSKNQLRRMTNLHSSSAVAFTAQLRDMLGGHYGEFMQNLVLPSADIDTEAMKNALGCIGCDEDAIVNVFGTITSPEIEALKHKYNETGVMDLTSKMHGKLEKESPFQKLMQAILSNPRESGLFSTDTHAQLETIHAICNEKTPSRDRDLFNLISKLSREDCEVLNDECLKKYNMKLDKVFSLKYSGNCLRVLKLWTLPRDYSVAQLLHDILHSQAEEYGVVANIIPKYDKIHLKSISDVYRATFNEDMSSRLDAVLTGNFKVAVLSWLNDPAFDGGHEEEVMMIGARHGSIANALHDEKALNAIQTAMRKQLDALVAFNASEGAVGDDAKASGTTIAKNSLPPITNHSSHVHQQASHEAESKTVAAEASPNYVEPEQKDAHISKNHSMDLHSLEVLDDQPIDPIPSPAKGSHTPLTGNEPSTPVKDSKLQRLASTRAINRSQSAFESKYSAVCNFLSEMFVVFDKDKSGFLESSEFWNILRSLDLGFSDEEIAGMAQWTDWDCDGSISYEEVVNELADSLITIIEGRGGDVINELSKISARVRKEQEDIDNMEKKGGLSPTLVQYLKDSFEAYDVDDNGGLGPDEFWKVLNVVLVETINGLKDVEIEELRVSSRMDMLRL
jgi:hypothetical protein